jgi:hypothetical protein
MKVSRTQRFVRSPWTWLVVGALDFAAALLFRSHGLHGGDLAGLTFLGFVFLAVGAAVAGHKPYWKRPDKAWWVCSRGHATEAPKTRPGNTNYPRCPKCGALVFYRHKLTLDK